MDSSANRAKISTVYLKYLEAITILGQIAAVEL